MTADWAPAFAGVTSLSRIPAPAAVRSLSRIPAPAAVTSHPRRRVPKFLLALFFLFFLLPAHAYTIEVPDFGRLEKDLRLKPLQKAQFDIAVQASQRALMSVALAGMQVKERLSAELAKPLPDLNALYGLHVEAYEMAAPNFRDAKNEWERFYRLLDQRQIESTKRFLRDSFGPYALGII